MLKGKTAVIYGGGGAVGSTVAKAFAREGAKVFLTGRTLTKLIKVAETITALGGEVEVAQVDALDANAVENHLRAVVQKTGSVDISFNAISLDVAQGSALVKMNKDQFTSPIVNAMNTQFITATAAIRHMMTKGSGVILAITANAARKPYANLGGFGVACAAIEGLFRQLALEAGEYGVRAVCLRSAGSPDSPGVDEVFTLHAEQANITREKFDNNFVNQTMLKRLPM